MNVDKLTAMELGDVAVIPNLPATETENCHKPPAEVLVCNTKEHNEKPTLCCSNLEKGYWPSFHTAVTADEPVDPTVILGKETEPLTLCTVVKVCVAGTYTTSVI